MECLSQMPDANGEQVHVPRICFVPVLIWLGLSIAMVSLDSMMTAIQTRFLENSPVGTFPER